MDKELINKILAPLHSRAIHIENLEHIEKVTSDSRFVVDKGVFVAIFGVKIDGHQFINKAIESGAALIILENPDYIPDNKNIGYLLVEDSRLAYSKIRAWQYRETFNKLNLIGITGTNGKTSSTMIIKQLLEPTFGTIGVIGTLGAYFGNEEIPLNHTTPDISTLLATLKTMVDAGINWVVMEVSSHALDQYRVCDFPFKVAIFTNLTQDHLDYHHTLENYFQAKTKLFKQISNEGIAIINYIKTSPWSDQLKTFCQDNQVKTLGIWDNNNNLKSELGIVLKKYKSDLHSTTATLEINTNETSSANVQAIDIQFPFIGYHNVQNVLVAVQAALFLGVNINQIIKTTKLLKPVAGRLERVSADNFPTVYVDYAHTPDGLKQVAKTLQNVLRNYVSDKIGYIPGSGGRLITVFGCGGDRDKGKRPLMAKIADKYSDDVYVTSDNPRTENPDDIINDIKKGIPQIPSANFYIESDRYLAIDGAIADAKIDDIVLIAGKGHEDYQIFGSKKYYFDDREIAKEVLRKHNEPSKYGVLLPYYLELISEQTIFQQNLRQEHQPTQNQMFTQLERMIIHSISTDTRQLLDGQVFVAIPGPRFDPLDFSDILIKKKCPLVIAQVSEANSSHFENYVKGNSSAKSHLSKGLQTLLDSTIPVVYVSDVVASLGILANLWVQKLPAKRVVITGSTGKTTTKELIASVCALKYQVTKTVANLNNQIGVPLTMLAIQPSDEVAIIEIGTNQKGEIEKLAKITEPDIALIVNVGPVHLEAFETLEGVSREKTDLFRSLSSEATAIINMDDPYLAATSSWLTCNIKTVSKTLNASAKLMSTTNQSITIMGENHLTTYPVVQTTSALTSAMLMAVAVADILQIDPQLVASHSQDFSNIAGRFDIKKVNDHLIVIDDAYNANPVSMKGSLDTFFKLYPNHKKLIVLGDMLELGSSSEQLHAEIGEHLKQYQPSAMVSVGKLSTLYGQPIADYFHIEKIEGNQDKILSWLLSTVRPNESWACLFKSSNGIKVRTLVSPFIKANEEK